MSNTLLKGLQDPYNSANRGLTANGADTLTTTGSELLNFYSTAGAARNMEPSKLQDLARKAYGADALDAMKLTFHLRDVRGGAGERQAFRTVISAFAKDRTRRPSVQTNLENIPFFGRWDDLFVLLDTPLEGDVVKLLKKQLEADLKAVDDSTEDFRKDVSLAGKWMPSINTSSKATTKLARKLAKAFGWTPPLYRKRLARLRKHINVVETLMSAKQWDKIDYGKLPSRAGMLYRKAFFNRDGDRYKQFQEDVASGKKTVNAQVLFPYEIVQKIRRLRGHRYYWTDEDLPNLSDAEKEQERLVMDNLWNNLADLEGVDETPTIVMADTSGSMTMSYGNSGNTTPMDISLSLAGFMAERLRGPFANRFISFSSRPELCEWAGADIYEKIENIKEIIENTDLQAAFELILKTGKDYDVPQDDMPARIIVVSDMEFDRANDGETNLASIRGKYAEAGYKIPELVYWNVNARDDNFPMSVDDSGTCMVSGASPAVFKAVLASEVITPVDVMRAAIDDPRYDCVRA